MNHSDLPVYVHGVASSVTWADARYSLTDLIFLTVSAGLKDAGVGIERIDSVVIGAHDLVDGRSLSSMVTAPAAGSYLRDEIRVSEDGLVAASLAAARLEGGEASWSVVAAWGRASESTPELISRAGFHPAFEQALGIREFDVSAMRLGAWLAKFPDAANSRAAVWAEMRRRAAMNPRSIGDGGRLTPTLPYPLAQEDGPRWADLVGTAIVGTSPSAVRITGVGHSTDVPRIAERDLLGMPSLKQAVDRALAAAGRTLAEVDFFEIDGMTVADEALALEALGLADPGCGFEAYARSRRFNPSGGNAAGWCYPAMGLMRMIECTLQLTGRAGAIQLETQPMIALAVGASPVGAQTHTAIILERAQ